MSMRWKKKIELTHRREPTKSREYCLTPIFESKGLSIDVSKTNEMIIID